MVKIVSFWYQGCMLFLCRHCRTGFAEVIFWIPGDLLGFNFRLLKRTLIFYYFAPGLDTQTGGASLLRPSFLQSFIFRHLSPGSFSVGVELFALEDMLAQGNIGRAIDCPPLVKKELFVPSLALCIVILRDFLQYCALDTFGQNWHGLPLAECEFWRRPPMPELAPPASLLCLRGTL